MNFATRAFIGAICGALFTLLLHPISRPFVVNSFRWGPSHALKTTPWLLDTNPVLPIPKTLFQASMWMEEGADRIRNARKLSAKELQQLVVVSQSAANEEPNNAFWLQMKAVFLDASGKRAEAVDAWMRAAKRDVWDDYQSKRLSRAQQELAGEQGSPSAWQYCSLYGERSLSMAHVIEAYARNLLKSQTFVEREGEVETNVKSLQVRHATLVNARLMRKGARAIAVGEIGSSLIEASSFPSDLGPLISPRKLILARNNLANAMAVRGMEEMAMEVRSTFNDNDGWNALISVQEAAQNTEELALLSLIVACGPSAILISGTLGILLWGLSVLFRRQPKLLKLTEIPIAPIIGILAALGAYWVTKLPFAALSIAASFAFLGFRSPRERTRPVTDLGLLFSFSLIVLGIVFVILFGLFITGLSTPGWEVYTAVDAPKDFYGGSSLFLGLSGIVLSVVLIMAPSWAMVYRMPTSSVLVSGLRTFGRGVFLGCMIAAVALVPLTIYLDGVLRNHASRILLNEPVYYLNR